MQRRLKFSILCIVLVVVLMISGCGKENKTGSVGDLAPNGVDSDKVQVVTSFYPIYYLATEIGGDAVEVTNLIASGVEPHNWSPKSKDLLVASNADLLLYHGAGFETWIDSFQKGLDKNSQVVLVEVSKGINLITPDDGHEHSDEAHHEHDGHDHSDEAHAEHDNHEHDEHGHSHTTDPHTFVSPKSALTLAKNIKQALIDINPSYKETFEANYTALTAKIEAIDVKYEEELAKFENRHIVVSHQSFGYVARDYNIEQIAIMGLNPNAEPRAQDIMEIANIVKEQGVKYIFFEELINDNLAKMLASEAKVDTMVLYSLEGLTTKQEKQGENYLSLMELNLQNLISALQ